MKYYEGGLSWESLNAMPFDEVSRLYDEMRWQVSEQEKEIRKRQRRR